MLKNNILEKLVLTFKTKKKVWRGVLTRLSLDVFRTI